MSCAALLLLAAAACVHAQSTITPQHCSSIANPLSKSLCSKYVQFSRADDKYRIAKDWSNKDYPSCEYLLPPAVVLCKGPAACMLTPSLSCRPMRRHHASVLGGRHAQGQVWVHLQTGTTGHPLWGPWQHGHLRHEQLRG
jgi:hypothetical protein